MSEKNSGLNERQADALRQFHEQLEEKGVSYVRAENGDVVFAFKRTWLQDMERLAGKNGDDRIVLLVKKDGGMALN